MQTDAWRLHRESGCDIRTAAKALGEGVDRIKGFALRQRIAESAKKLGIVLGAAHSSAKERAA